MKRKEFLFLLPFFLFVFFFSILFLQKPFFWDKDILDSKQAHWLFQNSFNLVFPNEIDSGHPPFIAFLLALGWTIFGKSLAVSHLLMLPFSLGLVYQTYSLIKKFTDSYQIPVLFLILLDTSMLTQMIVVSSDLVILFFFLLCINAILSNKRTWLLFGLIILAVVNMRGMMTCFGIFLFDILLTYKNLTRNHLIKNIFYYIPGAIVALSFISFHFIHKGWIMYHEDSPWKGCFEKVGWMGIARNLVIFVWRIMDFGRIIYGILFAYILFGYFKKQFSIPIKLRPLFLLLIVLLITYLPYFNYQNLLSHRYLLPFTLILSLLTLSLVIINFKNKTWIFILTGIFIAGGHFIVYPDKLAQGWDATLAHVPYHSLHKKMLSYLDSNNIELNQVGTVTPNLSAMQFLYLNNDIRSFNKKNTDKNNFILYSNVFNDFTDEDIDLLKNKWVEVKRFEKMNIKMILYKNPNIQSKP